MKCGYWNWLPETFSISHRFDRPINPVDSFWWFAELISHSMSANLPWFDKFRAELISESRCASIAKFSNITRSAHFVGRRVIGVASGISPGCVASSGKWPWHHPVKPAWSDPTPDWREMIVVWWGVLGSKLEVSTFQNPCLSISQKTDGISQQILDSAFTLLKS